MTFVSYAQNMEDVMLWRALKNVTDGFYIDVGACDPESDSVTKAFYDRGWSGINVEPVKSSYFRICQQRQRDINLNIALADRKKTQSFFCVDAGNGLSTSVREYADSYSMEGRQVQSIDIQTETLASVCEHYVNRDIHFLKIDVEGAELEVLEGADFSKFRPWIVVVESTQPNTQIQTHGVWEHILAAADYEFVYFDGLNRFYIAKEKTSELSEFFLTPPNYFDHFESSRYLELSAKLTGSANALSNINFPAEATGTELHEKVQKLIDIYFELRLGTEEKLKTLNEELDYCYQELYESSRYIGSLSKERTNIFHHLAQLQQAVSAGSDNGRTHQLELEISALRSSTSWRLTGPLRRVFRFIKTGRFK